MTEFESPFDNPNYIKRLRKLEEKKKKILNKLRIAKQKYEDADNEFDNVCEEIGLLNNEFGIYQNVR